MKINLTNETVPKMLKQLAKAFGTKVGVDCHEWGVRLPKSMGTGCVTGYAFQDGLSLMLFEGDYREDIELHITSEQPVPLYFTFCIEGSFIHIFDNKHMQYQLNPLLGTIAANPLNKTQIFKFPAMTPLTITILKVDRAAYKEKMECELELMPDKLRELFEDVEAKNPFLYQSNYSIAISECIKNIIDTDYEGLVRSTFIESKVLELLSLQIKQYEDDLSGYSKQAILREYDVERIKLAREILLEDLKERVTIPDLARRVGINQQKLKTGFKKVFNETIRQYLKSEKLEKARLLMLEGSMSVGEVATHVGYSNKSHFLQSFQRQIWRAAERLRTSNSTRSF